MKKEKSKIEINHPQHQGRMVHCPQPGSKSPLLRSPGPGSEALVSDPGKSGSKGLSVFQMTLTAVTAAVFGILGPLAIPIPFSPVPISFTNLVLLLSACILGWRLGSLSYLLYLAMGLIGLPVFSGFGSGIGKLLGPTGGYLIGMIFTAMICGAAFDRLHSPVTLFISLALGIAVSYVIGTCWLCLTAHLTLIGGLWAGVIPYMPGDIIKILVAINIGPVMKRRLTAAGLLTR